MTARVRKRISLVLIDDNLSAGEGVVARIRAQPGFHVLADSAGTEEALKQARQTKPDLVLLNLRREGDDSLMLAGALHGGVPKSRVIVMGLDPLHEDVASYVRAWVSGFLMADASFDTFLGTVHSVAQGTPVLPLQLTHALFGQLSEPTVRRRQQPAPDGKPLTRPERAVSDLIIRGFSNQEMAARLQIALRTVKRQAHTVLSKLAANRRLEVAVASV
jgi:DNA-binding NarL/FixJ family response regulator